MISLSENTRDVVCQTIKELSETLLVQLILFSIYLSILRSEQFVQDYFIRTSLTFIILLLWCKLLTRKLYEIGVTTYTHCKPLLGKLFMIEYALLMAIGRLCFISEFINGIELFRKLIKSRCRMYIMMHES